MAEIQPLHIELSEGLSQEMAKLSEQVKEARLLLTEDRIRAVIREELAAWEKHQHQASRVHQPIHYETKQK